LIELLVVIAIIAVLVSLLLPAVQQAREAARRTQCRNNMKQLGLALMNYESSYRVFPMEKITFTPVAQTWTTMVLPFLDQQPLYDLYNFSQEWSNPAQWPVTTVQLPVWICPSAPGPDGRTIGPISSGATNPADVAPPGGYGLCDYMALSGVRASLYVVSGLPMPPIMSLSVVNVSATNPIVQKENRWPCAMHTTKETKISEIIDGMSNTLMIAEDAGRPGLFASRLKVAVTSSMVPPYKSVTTSDGWGWADTGNSGAIDGCTYDGSFVNSSVKAIPPAYPTCPIPTNCQTGATCFFNCNNDSEMFSFHSGGVMVLFADGHVVFLNQDMSASTLGALLTRNAKDIPGDY
jgi:prepilin-type processing-associated H-X9-DG protein